MTTTTNATPHLIRVAKASRAYMRAQERVDRLLRARDEEIMSALAQGISGADIARAAGISRQRITDLSKRRR